MTKHPLVGSRSLRIEESTFAQASRVRPMESSVAEARRAPTTPFLLVSTKEVIETTTLNSRETTMVVLGPKMGKKQFRITRSELDRIYPKQGGKIRAFTLSLKTTKTHPEIPILGWAIGSNSITGTVMPMMPEIERLWDGLLTQDRI